MTLYDIVLFGEERSGKSALLNGLIGKQFVEDYEKSESINFATDKQGLNFWEIPKTLLETNLGKYCHPKCSLYCLDASKEINQEVVREEIQKFRNQYPKSALLLVSTYADLKHKADTSEIIDLFDAEFTVSVKETLTTETNQFARLRTTLVSVTENPFVFLQLKTKQTPALHQALEKLVQSAKTLPLEKQEALAHAASDLWAELMDHTNPNKHQTIRQFHAQCEEILEDSLAWQVLYGVAVFAAAAVTFVLATTLGMIAGFIIGLPLGPESAFLCAFMIGGLLGSQASLAAGNWVGQRLFQPAPQMEQVTELAQQACSLG